MSFNTTYGNAKIALQVTAKLHSLPKRNIRVIGENIVPVEWATQSAVAILEAGSSEPIDADTPLTIDAEQLDANVIYKLIPQSTGDGNTFFRGLKDFVKEWSVL